MPGHPPIDRDLVTALSAPDLLPASVHPQDIPARRAAAVVDRAALTRGGAIRMTEIEIPGASGKPGIPAAVLSRSAGTGAPPGPGIMFVHGGGMILGSRYDIDDSMLDAAEMGATVVSLEYRLAPEHPFPAAIDDCLASWVWLCAHAGEWGIDPDSLAIAGSSAGGGLAAGTTLLIRDRGHAIPARQILYCPMLDDRELTASSRELKGEGRWDRIANRTGWTAYLGDRRGGDDVPIYAAPARATQLRGLPPTFIDVGDVETFRDEDIDYAVRLSRAGVPVELHVWPGGVHGFTALAPQAPLSQAAMRARRDYLRRGLFAQPR